MSRENESIIWTDAQRTKELIWQAYEGYVDKYNIYMMYHHLKRDDMVSKVSLDRYANYFFEEVNDFLDSFKKRLGEEDIKKVRGLFLTLQELKLRDYIFLRRFFAKFMNVSGIKNIVKIKDNRDGAERVADRYKIDLDGDDDD